MAKIGRPKKRGRKPEKKKGDKPGRKFFNAKDEDAEKLIIDKLEEVFLLGGTDEEACFYANVGLDSLYHYQKANPEWTERKKLLKQKQFLVARQSIMKGIKEDYNFAMSFAKRKMAKEFGDKLEITNNNNLNVNILQVAQILNLTEADFEKQNYAKTIGKITEYLEKQGGNNQFSNVLNSGVQETEVD